MYQFKINTVIGHRGCSKTKFGNTLEAFAKAVELGAEMIEFDVRRTKDGVMIVHHDADVFGHLISSNRYVDLAHIAGQKGLEIATLEQTLHFLRHKAHPDIELKESGCEDEVVRLALKYFKPSEFIVKSFHDEAVRAVKEIFPDVSAGLLLGTNGDLKMDAWIKPKILRIAIRKIRELYPWRRVAACGADFIAPHKGLLFMGMLKSAAKKKIPLLVWTVDDKKTISSLMATGLVSGIITDEPGLAKSLR